MMWPGRVPQEKRISDLTSTSRSHATSVTTGLFSIPAFIEYSVEVGVSPHHRLGVREESGSGQDSCKKPIQTS